MKNKLKIALLLSLMLIMLFAVSAQAKTKVTGKCGENATWTFNRKTKTMKISGKGDLATLYTNRLYKYLRKTETLKIGKNIETVYYYSLCGLGDDKDVCVVIYGSPRKFEHGSLDGADKIKLYGDAKGLSDAVSGGGSITEVKVSAGNKDVIVKNDMVLSADGKKLYMYFGDDETVTIPDSVRTICQAAFYYSKVKEVSLGENVKKIGNIAFYGSQIKTLVCNDKLKSIGIAAFEESKLKNINLPDGVDIDFGAFYKTKLKTVELGSSVSMSARSFFWKTTIIPADGFKKASPCMSYTMIYEHWNGNEDDTYTTGVDLKWTPVEGADGYEVVLKQGDTKLRWTQKKSTKTLYSDELEFDAETYDDTYYLIYYGVSVNGLSQNHNTLKNVDNPLYVKVRAYKEKKNGKVVYSKWSTVQVVESYERHG